MLRILARVLRWALALGLLAIAVLWPLLAGGTDSAGAVAEDDPVVITELQADFQVGADGTMAATETVTGYFPPGRHGLFRFWDTTNPNEPGVRQRPILDSVTVDGDPARTELSTRTGERLLVAKIGDPDIVLTPGLHVYQLRYRIPGVLDPGDTGADRRFASGTGDTAPTATAFYWNVVAPAWNNRIDHASITVTLPGEITGAQCSVGLGLGRACDDLSITGHTLTVEATALRPHTPVTVRAGVDVPTPERLVLPWGQRWDAILGTSVAGVQVVLGLTLAAAVIGVAAVRATREPAPGFPLQYAPPPGLGPVQCEYLRTESVPPGALAATLLHLAERGVVSLTRRSADDWKVTTVPGAPFASIDPVGRAVAGALNLDQPGGKFSANGTAKAGEKLRAAGNTLDSAVRKWARDAGLLVPRRSEWLVRVANVVALILLVLASIRWLGAPTMWVLPFGAFFYASAPGWLPGVGTRRTAEGRRVWSTAEGFHRMLATDSAPARFDFSARNDLYTAYLPFAAAARGGIRAGEHGDHLVARRGDEAA
ncbi:hypothetical protein BST26_10045, partial [Mycolicibacterium insubricum]